MDKTKKFLLGLISCLLAFVLVFCACSNDAGDGDDDDNDTDNTEVTDDYLTVTDDNLALESIALGGSYKTEYSLGDSFSSEGLTVTATYTDITSGTTETATLSASDYTVDSSEYNSAKVGTYTISVNYTHALVTRSATYTVAVTSSDPSFGGISVNFADNAVTSYTLTSDAPTVTISSDIVDVYKVNGDGEVTAEKYSSSDYTVALYLGTTLKENMTADVGGVYTLLVTLNGTTIQSWLKVTVIVGLSKIEFVSDDDNAVTTQTAGSDIISSTWSFTVTYANGAEKTVSTGDTGLSIDIDTRTTGVNKTATVTYTETLADGSSAAVTTTVTYTIEEDPDAGNTVIYSIDFTDTSKFRASDVAGTNISEAVEVTDKSNTGTGFYVTKSSNSSGTANKIGSQNDVQCLQMQGSGDLSQNSVYTYVDAGSVTISVSYFSGSTSRYIRAFYGNNGSIAYLDTEIDTTNDSSNEALTTADKGIKTRTITVEAWAGGNIYLGSASSGIYITAITITLVKSSSDDPQTATELVFVAASDTAVTDGAVLASNDYATITMAGGGDLDSSSKNIYYSGAGSVSGDTMPYKIKLSGAFSVSEGTISNGIKIEVQQSCTIKVYARSGSSSEDRNATLYTVSDNTKTDVGNTSNNLPAKTVGDYVYEIIFENISVGTYYFGSTNSGIGVYGVSVIFN